MKFSYRARNLAGEAIKGEFEAPDVEAFRAKLKEDNLTLIDYTQKSTVAAKGRFWDRFLNQPKLDSLLMFFRQLQIIYTAGIPVLKGLNFIHEQEEDKHLKEVEQSIIKDLSEGLTFHEAAAKYTHVFSPVTVSLIRAGEASGTLDTLLEKIASNVEEQHERRDKIKSATFYPKLVFGMIAVVFLVLVYFVLPKFKQFYVGLNIELPAITRFLMALSKFCIDYWYVMALAVVAMVFGVRYYLSSESGKLVWHRFQLKVPIFGKITLLNETQTFCSVLGLLLEAGMPILQALEIVSSTLANKVIKDGVVAATERVRAGESLAEGLNEVKHFPSMMVSLIAVGEESGSLSAILFRFAAHSKGQLDYRISSLSKAIEPILLFVVFGIAIVFALALFLPMWKMSGALRK